MVWCWCVEMVVMFLVKRYVCDVWCVFFLLCGVNELLDCCFIVLLCDLL